MRPCKLSFKAFECFLSTLALMICLVVYKGQILLDIYLFMIKLHYISENDKLPLIFLGIPGKILIITALVTK